MNHTESARLLPIPGRGFDWTGVAPSRVDSGHRTPTPATAPDERTAMDAFGTWWGTYYSVNSPMDWEEYARAAWDARQPEIDRLAAELAAQKTSYAELWQSQQDLATDCRESEAELAELRAACEEAASAAGMDWLEQQLKLAALLSRTPTTEAPR